MLLLLTTLWWRAVVAVEQVAEAHLAEVAVVLVGLELALVYLLLVVLPLQ
jgi:inner membrane protein involved in colicin E2 resistance